jgi:hypothetical protein
VGETEKIYNTYVLYKCGNKKKVAYQAISQKGGNQQLLSYAKTHVWYQKRYLLFQT